MVFALLMSLVFMIVFACGWIHELSQKTEMLKKHFTNLKDTIELIRENFTLRAEKRILEAKVKILEKQLKENEEE